MSTCRNTNIGLGIVIVLIIIVLIVLLVTGNIHFGKAGAPTPTPPPPPPKASCAEYPLSQCQGSRTTTGKVCMVTGAVCVEYVQPGPQPPPPLDPVNIATWFLANPHKQVRLRPKDSILEYQLSYEGLTTPPDGPIGAPSVAVVGVLYTNESGSTTQDVNARTVFNATASGRLSALTTLAKASAPTSGVIDRVQVQARETLSVNAIHTAAPNGYRAFVDVGLRVNRLNPDNTDAGSLGPITFP